MVVTHVRIHKQLIVTNYDYKQPYSVSNYRNNSIIGNSYFNYRMSVVLIKTVKFCGTKNRHDMQGVCFVKGY